MTYILILFVIRHPTLTPSAFRTHYETTHMPLVQSIAGPNFPIAHKRTYIHRSEDAPHDAMVLVGDQAGFECDAIAELSFEDDEHFKAFMGAVGTKEAKKKLENDEEMFMDRGKMRAVVAGGQAVTQGRS